MSLKLKCPKCKGTYTCGVENTRIYGPRIETRCPFCKVFIDKNVSAYTQEQMFLNGVLTGRFIKANEMITLARELAKLVNADEPYLGKKKNLRDELPDL